MRSLEEELKSRRYPGRGFVLERLPDESTLGISYFITGRSPPSQARLFEKGETAPVVSVEITDVGILEKESPALILYPALTSANGVGVVSNGAQTELLYGQIAVFENMADQPLTMLTRALSTPVHRYDKRFGWIDITKHEPDRLKTPRISGAIECDRAAIAISRYDANDDGQRTDYYHTRLRPGTGLFVCTYTGNEESPAAFEGEPVEVALPGDWYGAEPQQASEQIFRMLAPPAGKPDLRVGVASMFQECVGQSKLGIVNRHTMKTASD